MYEEFYGLTEKPFSIQPDPAFLYWGRGHRLAYAMLEYGVVNQAGISVITGEVGCGKTTLIHRLLDQLSPTHTVALLSNIQSGRGELLSWVLMGYGEPYAGKNHVEMFSQLQQFFIREYAKGKRVVLIIDEAQNLSVDMLEELRMLSNINAGKDQLLQLILVGQPQLKDLLSRPDMLQLAQRIGSDFHLTPLSREEVHAYIETRMTIAGAREGVFTERAMDLIAEQSRGVPRVINIIADTALVYAFSAQEERVEAEIVQSVIRDKVDYGVFGLASSPDLKLAEGSEKRRATGFLRDTSKQQRKDEMTVSAQIAPPARRAAVEHRAEPRMVANMAVKLAPEAASFAVETAPSPAIEEQAHAEPKKKKPARAGFFSSQSAKDAAAAQAPAAPAAVLADEIGVVVIGDGDGMTQTALSAPEGITVVTVAPAGSAAASLARDAGLDHVELDVDQVGGGRARNAGYRRLKKVAPHLKYVQFIEAGALIDPEWLAHAWRFMARRPEVAALEGRVLPTAPTESTFRRILDKAMNRDDGEVQAASATALFRADAFEAAGGFRGDILADETADLCIRLRRRGAHVWRSEATMALKEPEPMSFAQWRRRAAQNGYAYAAGAALHGGPPERYCERERSRAVLWGAVFPAAIALAAILAAAGGALFGFGAGPVLGALAALGVGVMIYALKIAATAIGAGPFSPFSWVYGATATLGHFYEFAGVARYWSGDRKGAAARRSSAG